MSDATSIDSLTPEQKVSRIDELRRRVLAGEAVTQDELADGVRLLRDIRGTAASSRGKAPKAAPKPLSLSDF